MPVCKNPYMAGTLPCPCNKCIPCLINRKRLWTHRILLESYHHENSAFVTLTYDNENLPYVNSDTKEDLLSPTLSPSDLKNFLKRIRRSVSPARLRYYGVGEYGDRSWRPHFHVALFGYEPCWHGQTRKEKHQKGKPCCPPCDEILKKWGKGGIDNARIENDSAGYIAGYVTKKLTSKEDGRLNGRYPEFSRMSRKPGLGAIDMSKVSELLFSEHGKYLLTQSGDVPISLTHGKRQMPLGRYLRDQLRDQIGSDGTPQEKAKLQYIQELRVMWMDHIKNKEIPKEKKLSLKQFIQDQDHQKILNIESRFKHNQRKKSL